MTLTKTIPALLGALAISVTTAFAADEPAESLTVTPTKPTATTENTLIVNPFDLGQWYDGAGDMSGAMAGKPEHVNMAHPAFWFSFIDPKTHTKRHMQFMNPAMYAQFMKPRVYIEFINPANWLAWFDPKNYALFIEAETYTYWMQPGAYMHAMSPHGYMQAFELSNYAELLDPRTPLAFFDPDEYVFSATTSDLDKAVSSLDPVAIVTSMFAAASNIAK